MAYKEDLTRYVAHFIDELAASGMTDVVISPGSRSTPLAMTVLEHPGLQEWIIIDERSAAFFALGMAKQTRRPVALICTSGTAAANYYPAIVEAHYSRVPLIVLTADRPHELRDVGAPQAINQNQLYGVYSKWFHEMALPESSNMMLNYARSTASKAVSLSQQNNAGPVHLNFPLREPLVPDFELADLWGKRQEQLFHHIYDGEKRLPKDMLNIIVEKTNSKQRGVIVCGPQMKDDLAEKVSELANIWQIPILADPLSNIRSGSHSKANIIEGYDSFLRNKDIRDSLKPDYIIRFGAMPVSKAYLFYVQENADVTQFVVDDVSEYRDSTGNSSEFIYADSALFCEDILDMSRPSLQNDEWIDKWRYMNGIAKDYLKASKVNSAVTEGSVVQSLLNIIPDDSSLYVGNSMAIRDLDTFFMTTSKQLAILANRGANGIDGMVSSGLGAAAQSKTHMTLLLGDLSFYHDLNGLLAAKQYSINLTIVLVNNNGGGIFSFLPQAKEGKHFEPLFGTPLNIDFQPIIEMYGGHYSVAKTKEMLELKLREGYTTEGLSVIEVKTNRSENSQWHKELWEQIHLDILQK